MSLHHEAEEAASPWWSLGSQEPQSPQWRGPDGPEPSDPLPGGASSRPLSGQGLQGLTEWATECSMRAKLRVSPSLRPGSSLALSFFHIFCGGA